MKFLSGLVTQASGSLGGMTASRNRGGMYLRSRVKPVNPDTGRQIEVRNSLSLAQSLWADSLSPTQRDGWDLYAEQVPVMGKLGQEIQLSGINHFIRSNVPRLQIGESAVLNAPSIFSLAPLVDISGSGVTTASISNVVVDFTTIGDWNSTDGAFLIVAMSRPENEFVVPRGPFRVLGAVDGDSMSPPASGTLDAAFPRALGQRVRLRARLSLPDGRLSSFSSVDVTVGSP